MMKCYEEEESPDVHRRLRASLAARVNRGHYEI